MFEKKRGTRFLASVMALVMLLSLAPVGALATEDEGQPAENQPVAQSAVESKDQTNENTPTEPAKDSDSAEATKSEGDFDESFSNADTSDNDNGIAAQNLSLNEPAQEQSITAEYWVTNAIVSVDGSNSMTISQDYTDITEENGVSVESLAPETGEQGGNTAIFWQARVLGRSEHQTGNLNDDKTASGTEIDSIRFQNNEFQYHDKNGNSWKSFNSSNDQLVFYYLIRTDYSQMVQIDVSDWTVNDEPSNSQYPSHRGVTYQVIVDGGNDNGKVLDSKTFWYNRDLTVSAIRVRQTQSENYTISEVELTPNNLGTVVKENGEYQFSLNLENANTAEATVKIYVKPNVQPKQLSYQLNGGTITSNTSDYTVAGEVYPDAPVVTPSVSKEGYTFDGWYTDANFQNQWTGNTMPKENLALYAKWTGNVPVDPTPDTMVTANYYINLDGKDASNPYGKGTFTSGIEIENAINKRVFNDKKKTDITSNSGYIFNINGVDATLLNSKPTEGQVNNKLSESMSIGGNTGREVVWYHVSLCSDGYHVDGYIKNVAITITYNPDGGTFADNSTNNMTKQGLSGQAHTIIADIPTKSGYVFAGWKVEGDSSNKIYKNGESITPMSDLTLVAQWRSNVETVTLTYHENFGETEHTCAISVDKDSPQTVQSYAELRRLYGVFGENAGFYFAKWNTQENGEGDSYREGSTISMTGPIHLYAQWKKVRVPKVAYTINQHFMDGNGKEISNLYVKGQPQTEAEGTPLSNLIGNKANTQTNDGKKYVYVPSETKVNKTSSLEETSTLTKNTTIDLYYYLDNWKDADNTTDEQGKDSETDGDGIPDCDQVLIKYVSSNSDRGTVSPDMEVLTIRGSDKQPTNKGTVTASGSTATVTGSSRNYFSNWTDKTGKQVGANATLEEQKFTAKGGETYIFTANFGHRSSSGGSSRPSTPTVTIPDDVPTGLNGKDHYAYIIGYGNNDVRPQNNITRAEVATIFFRLLTDETREANMTKSNGYNDVKDGDWFCCAVSTLSKMGIIKGYEDGSFKPDQKITRAETMTLVNRVLNRLPEAKDDLHKDMKTWVDNMDETAWYYLAVQEATNSHYFKNKTGTKFEQWTDLRDTRDWSELEK